MSGVSVQQAWSHDQVEKIRGLWQRYDSQLIIAVLALMGIGLVIVASSSISIATRALGDLLYYFWRQSVSVVLGLVMYAGCDAHSLEGWRPFKPPYARSCLARSCCPLASWHWLVIGGTVGWCGVAH